MRAARKGKARASIVPAGKAGSDRAGGRQEEGFALPMVLFIITLLAVLGATSLVMAIYSMMNAQGTLPAAKAFDAAESGLSVAHSSLARDNILPGGTATPITGSVEANSVYSVTVLPDPASPEWKITSTGTYTDTEGNIYKRTVEEKLTFAGTQKYFNALDYVLFSKRGSIVLDVGGWVKLGRFLVTGNVYARDVTIADHLFAGIGYIRVAGNVYGYHDASLEATSVIFSASLAHVTGSVYANNTAHMRADALLSISYSRVDGNVYYGNSYDEHERLLGFVDIKGSKIQQAGCVPDVALPEPDFDWYRSQAKVQDADAYSDGQHYFPGNATIASLNIDPNSNLSSGWIGFCEGNLTMQNVLINTNAKGVFVSAQSITVTHSWQLQGKTEYQAIAKGRVIHNSGMTLNLNPTDTVFIYSGYYNEANPAEAAVQYSLGSFRDIKGQITAKGSIYCPDADWLVTDCGITYKKPSVPVAGFPIPFQVKSWKEVASP